MCFIAFLLELGNPFSSMAIREMNILADVGGVEAEKRLQDRGTIESDDYFRNKLRTSHVFTHFQIKMTRIYTESLLFMKSNSKLPIFW